MKTTKQILVESIGNELPFRVPDNYFDQFASQLERQIGYTPVSKHKFFKPWMYMAAAVFAGIVVLTPVVYTTHKRTMALNTENYESYVLSQVDETVLLDCYVDDNSTK